jgi:hypothetical protein
VAGGEDRDGVPGVRTRDGADGVRVSTSPGQFAVGKGGTKGDFSEEFPGFELEFRADFVERDRELLATTREVLSKLLFGLRQPGILAEFGDKAGVSAMVGEEYCADSAFAGDDPEWADWRFSRGGWRRKPARVARLRLRFAKRSCPKSPTPSRGRGRRSETRRDRRRRASRCTPQSRGQSPGGTSETRAASLSAARFSARRRPPRAHGL